MTATTAAALAAAMLALAVPLRLPDLGPHGGVYMVHASYCVGWPVYRVVLTPADDSRLGRYRIEYRCPTTDALQFAGEIEVRSDGTARDVTMALDGSGPYRTEWTWGYRWFTSTDPQDYKMRRK